MRQRSRLLWIGGALWLFLRSAARCNCASGIDPTGGTNPFVPPSSGHPIANPLDAYVQQAVEAVAQSDKVTVFVWSSPQYSQKHVEIYVDNASLVVTGQGAVPTAAAHATACSPRSQPAQPRPLRRSRQMPQTYTVVAGDTLSAIAQRYNLTLDQLLALNPGLTRDSVIQVGQVINVAGTGADAGRDHRVAPTATPQPSPTLAPTDATPTPAVADHCA